MDEYSTIAHVIFGGEVKKRKDRYYMLQKQLRQAHMAQTYEVYVSVAYMTSIIVGIIGGLLGLLLGFLLSGSILRSTNFANPTGVSIPFINVIGQVIVLFVAMIILGAIGYIITFTTFLLIPSFNASERKSRINKGLASAVTFMYAMSKGGTDIITIIRSLHEAESTYGEVSKEVGFIIRDMDYFGNDLRVAILNCIAQTPSDMLQDLLSNLLSVIDSGGDVTTYLNNKVEQYRHAHHAGPEVVPRDPGPDRRVLRDDVRGRPAVHHHHGLRHDHHERRQPHHPLYPDLRRAAHRLGHVHHPDQHADARRRGQDQPLRRPDAEPVRYRPRGGGGRRGEGQEEAGRSQESAGWHEDERVPGQPDRDHLQRTDQSAVHQCPARHHRRAGPDVRRLAHDARRHALRQVLQSAIECDRGGEHMQNDIKMGHIKPSGDILSLYGPIIGFFDDFIVFFLMIALIPLAYFYEMKNHRERKIASEMPDFLKKLSSTNETGMTLTQSINLIANNNFGMLSTEVQKVHKDMQWGTDVNTALKKFANQLRTNASTKVITLITKAASSSGDIKDVLNIAANDARINEQIRRERFDGMLIYVVIIFISFVVFIYCVYTLTSSFIPVMATAATASTSSAGSSVAKQGGASFIAGLQSRGLCAAVLPRSDHTGTVCGHARRPDGRR